MKKETAVVNIHSTVRSKNVGNKKWRNTRQGHLHLPREHVHTIYAIEMCTYADIHTHTHTKAELK